jgi:glycosidase
MKQIRLTHLQRIRERLADLYGEDRADSLLERFVMVVGRYGVGLQPRRSAASRWNHNDVFLITYADSIREPEQRPLTTLRLFCAQRLKGLISGVHILPFSPWSSDDGFSVIDYRTVAPEYGRWDDIEALGADFSLMFDLVLNHCSRHSAWFQEFVTGIAPAKAYFHDSHRYPELEPDNPDLRLVTRPRPWPLLTKTNTRQGDAYVWTTFSEDQVDLDFSNPDVFFEFLDILFLYLSKGVRILRLDAVAFLWKQLGTNCVHLPQTHNVVKLFRDVLETVAPQTVLLTETNVPHTENISYFGKSDEAHMVYNFSLPPLLLHALLREDGSHLTRWARSLESLPAGCTFFNFTASHDGIGVRPLQGILETSELDWLVEQVRARGGEVSTRAMPDGSEQPYELNITYFSALRDPGGEAALGEARFLCSQAVALSFYGLPAVYLHCLTGTENDHAGFAESGQKRRLNRRKWQKAELHDLLEDASSTTHRVFHRYAQMLRRRRDHPAFDPSARMEVFDLGPAWLSFTRTALDRSEKILCLFNLTKEPRKLSLADLHTNLGESGATVREILSASSLKTGPRRTLTFAPYQAMWIVLRFNGGSPSQSPANAQK